MSANKVKLANKIGLLCSMQQSGLDKLKRESNQWTPIFAGEVGDFKLQIIGELILMLT
jgi:hypothetical protein